jgi:hypothetical protein
MLTFIRSLPLALVKGAMMFVLGGAILCQVVQQCGRGTGVVYVHVTTPDVDVTIDDATFHLHSLEESPIVCDLLPGGHVLRMLRGERVLFDEEFMLGPGEERVMVAWDTTAREYRQSR